MRFQNAAVGEGIGHLSEPLSKFLIIDGQHRLAALRFYLQSHPEEASTIRVPCMIFDGRSEDFAAEMFVIINSTPTRINKSHLVDLYERVSWAAPDRKFASRIVTSLYAEPDSPLRYRINRLGGAQPEGQKDPAGGAIQRDLPLGETRLASHPGGRRRLAHGRCLLRDGARLLQGCGARLGRRLGARLHRELLKTAKITPV